MTALAPYARWRALLPDLSGLADDEAWSAFQAAHGGRCAICRRPSAARLIVDHCHCTGYVRGLLCRGCNQRAGSGWLHRRLALSATPAVDLYVQFPPAAVCGLRRRYAGVFDVEPDDRLAYVIWHAGPAGTMSGDEIIAGEVVAMMRQRTWEDQ